MDETREARIRDYERWVCEALRDPADDSREDRVAESPRGGDNLVDFPAPGENPTRGADLLAPETPGPVRRRPGTLDA